MNNGRIVLWRYGSGEPELEYDPSTNTMFYTEAHKTYAMNEDSKEGFAFQGDAPGHIRCQQEILNDIIFEHTNWLTLPAYVQPPGDA